MFIREAKGRSLTSCDVVCILSACGLNSARTFRPLTIRVTASPLHLWPFRPSARQDVPKLFEDETIRKTVESDLEMIKYYDLLIPQWEWYIFAKTTQLYQKELAILTSARGMGRIIALTILFEVDSIDRFPSVQDFASYARVVKCTHESAGKKYGTGGAKIGNPYLKYVFSEAAGLMALYNPRIKTYLQKIEPKHGKGKSKIILAHKIARAVYYRLKRSTVFDIDKFLPKGYCFTVNN